MIPRHLMRPEAAREALDRVVVTKIMHERKKVMFINADAVVVLPGGCGSPDERFEVLTWHQLGLHAKPIVLRDVAGCWQPLLRLLRRVVAEGFAEASVLGFVTAAPDVAALEAALREALA